MAIERRFHLDFLQESYERGHVKGEADALLKVLQARGIEVPGSVRDLIVGCTDDEQLLVWIVRAAVARSVDELFDLPDAA
jgi:hypothetical protein